MDLYPEIDFFIIPAADRFPAADKSQAREVAPAAAGWVPAGVRGAADELMAQPARVKERINAFIRSSAEGSAALRQFQLDAERGLLGFVHSSGIWAAEEFLYHGRPGVAWNPIDEYLADERLLSDAARSQLRLWKQAKLGTYRVTTVLNDVVLLQPWNVLENCRCAAPMVRAVVATEDEYDLCASRIGQIAALYVAPWAGELDLSLVLRLVSIEPPDRATYQHWYLSLNHADVAFEAFPWDAGSEAERACRRQWRQRDWGAWLTARLECPFEASMDDPGTDRLAIRTITRVLPATRAQCRDVGLYLVTNAGPDSDEPVLVGMTAVIPTDYRSPNQQLLAEYRAYRKWAGPPRIATFRGRLWLILRGLCASVLRKLLGGKRGTTP